MTETRAEDFKTAILQSDEARVSILSLGCITQDWQVLAGRETHRVILGYADVADYMTSPYYMGVIAGRVANRIGHGRFDLSGDSFVLYRNAHPHTLHGGQFGLGRRNWKMERAGTQAVQLTYRSDHGEEGFPGAIDFSIVISLQGATLSYEMRALPDRPTPINLAQHSYYTLGERSIADLRLTLPANEFARTDATGLPTGELVHVANTAWDFRPGRMLKDADPAQAGIDHTFVLPTPSAEVALRSPSGLRLHLETDQPGIQVYTSAHLGTHGTPLACQVHAPFSAICLEPQNYPDAVNKPHFPDPIYTPDRPYVQRLSVTVARDA